MQLYVRVGGREGREGRGGGREGREREGREGRERGRRGREGRGGREGEGGGREGEKGGRGGRGERGRGGKRGERGEGGRLREENKKKVISGLRALLCGLRKQKRSVAKFQESGVLYDQTLHFSENWILSQDLQLPVLLKQG